MTALKIYRDIEQNTPAWDFLRLGMPTTSCFRKIHNAAGSVSKQKADYLNEIAAELVWRKPGESWRGGQMVRGHEQEPEAIEAYCIEKELELGVNVHQVAFIRVDTPMVLGCSPDLVYLTGDEVEGGAEIKTLSTKRMWEWLKAPGVPTEHMAQLQGSMMITGAKWWDLCMYCPGEDPHVIRVPADPAYQKDLKKVLQSFYAELERDLQAVKKQTLFTFRQALDERVQEVIEEQLAAKAAAEDDSLNNVIEEIEPDVAAVKVATAKKKGKAGA